MFEKWFLNVRKRKNWSEIDNLANYLLQLAISYDVVCLGETRVSKDVAEIDMPKLEPKSP